MSKHLALAIGNNYVGTESELSGCVNDAQDWTAFLTSHGYEVTTILEATRAQALGALEEMIARAGWGDRVVFTYSGHGTWLPDENGDELDGYDEALVMVDYLDGGLILDDEIHEEFGKLHAGAGGLLLPDSCFSGTATRFVNVSGDGAPRFLSPARILPEMSDTAATRIEETVPRRLPTKTASLISGCAEDEYSYDASFGGRPNGAFTRVAIDSYVDGMRLVDWHKAIRSTLPMARYPQSPRLEPASLYRRYAKAL